MDDLPYPTLSRYWGTCTMYILLCFSPFLFTYLSTYLSYQMTLRSNKQDRTPPVAPYWIPWVGYLVAFLRNPAEVLLSITEYCGKNVPSRIRIAGRDIYLISGSSHINFIWKNSEFFNPKAIQLACMRTVLKLNSKGAEVCRSDDSGRGPRPHPKSCVEPDNRIWFHTHDTAARFLSGLHLTNLTSNFQRCLEDRIGTIVLGHRWIEQTDLYSFVYDMMFPSQIEALFGTSFLQLNPTFPSDFRDFHSGLSYLLLGYPRWMVPKAWDARERCLEGIKKYHACLDKEKDEKTQHGGEKDFIYGSEFIRARERMHTKMKGLDADAIASSELGVIWAASSNIITAAFWSVVELIKDPHLLSKIRDEISVSASASSDSDTTRLALDPKKLSTQPLFQSVFAEVLRLYAYVFLVNSSDHREFLSQGWTIPKNQMVAISSHTAHMDTKALFSFETGNNEFYTFWAERFLVHPATGLRTPLDKAFSTGQIPTLSKFRAQPQGAEHTEKVTPDFMSHTQGSLKFSLSGLTSTWMPFGGGYSLCPGRHLAKEEILLSIAMLITSFDFEFVETRDVWDRIIPKRWRGRKEDRLDLDLDMRYFGTGVLPCKKSVQVKIRRRGGDVCEE